ncbi:MAG: hypothetical protein IKX70_06280 [Treponema sp.]|nr:hypothetical protein [Treponema sp.]
MTEREKQEILNKTKDWFKSSVMANHIINSKKLVSPNQFQINPFLTVYLANFLTGNSSPESIAKALIYPRVLGTSITTSFGTQIQKFTTTVLKTYASLTPGIDIEFDDQIDGRHKYCQLKAGPNCINKDDVVTISDHFKAIKNLGRTNHLTIGLQDLVVGVIYGENSDLSDHYKKLTKDYNYPVFVGIDFWTRLTGDHGFYYDLIKAISEVVDEADFSSQLEQIIKELSESDKIQSLSINLINSSSQE